MKQPKLLYTFNFFTCRDTPFLARKDIVKGLSGYFELIYGSLGEVVIESWDTPLPNEIEITVSTSDTSKAPNQIFWAISRNSAAYLEENFSDLSKLPSIWTRRYQVRTKGKL